MGAAGRLRRCHAGSVGVYRPVGAGRAVPRAPGECSPLRHNGPILTSRTTTGRSPYRAPRGRVGGVRRRGGGGGGVRPRRPPPAPAPRSKHHHPPDRGRTPPTPAPTHHTPARATQAPTGPK